MALAFGERLAVFLAVVFLAFGERLAVVFLVVFFVVFLAAISLAPQTIGAFTATVRLFPVNTLGREERCIFCGRLFSTAPRSTRLLRHAGQSYSQVIAALSTSLANPAFTSSSSRIEAANRFARQGEFARCVTVEHVFFAIALRCAAMREGDVRAARCVMRLALASHFHSRAAEDKCKEVPQIAILSRDAMILHAGARRE